MCHFCLSVLVVPQRVVIRGGAVSVEAFPQTQGGVKLWSGLFLLSARLVSNRLR